MSTDKIIMKTKEVTEAKKKSIIKWPKVAIIILNWNGWKDTIECLESVFRNTYPNYQVIVVDNGSTDGSIEKIKAWADGKQEVLTPEPTHQLYHLSHPPVKKPIPYIYCTREEAERGGNLELEEKVTKEWQEQKKSNNKELNPTSPYPIIFIQTDENLGFAVSNNIAIKKAHVDGYDYVLLLNNDTLVKKTFLTNMLIHAEEDKNVGIVGCKVCFAYNHDRIWYAGGSSKLALKVVSKTRGVGEVDRSQYNSLKEVSFVTGAVMLVKRRLIEDIGLLDERFFLGREDFDFCRRARKAGYRLLYAPEAVVWHKVGKSRDGKEAPIRVYQSYKTDIVYMKKHLPKPIWLLWFFLCAIYGLTVSSLRGSRALGIDIKSHRQAVLLALKEGFRDDAVTKSDIRRAQEYLITAV